MTMTEHLGPLKATEPRTWSIHWRCNTNGTAGVSRNRYTRQEAETAADQFNAKFPDIEHTAVNETPTN